MKTRDVIEHLRNYEELIDDVGFLSIEVSNVGDIYMKIHCSSFEQATNDLFKNNASDVVITKNRSDYIKISLCIENVEYFMMVYSEERVNYILKGE